MKAGIALELFFLKNFLNFEKIDVKIEILKRHKLPPPPPPPPPPLPLTLKMSQ